MTTDLTHLSTPLILGGNTFGWTSDQDESFAVLDAYVAAGGRVIDTADVYSAWGEGHTGGESERVIGAWLAARDAPDDLVIATKAGMLEGFTTQDEATVNAALDASLRRLGVESVGLFYAHRDDEQTPVEEQARVYDAIVRSGRARAVGVSNYSPERMRAWFEHARENGLAEPQVVQVQYHLLARRDHEQGHRPIAEEFGAAVYPYFSLASGLLTGKYRSPADLSGAAREGFLQGHSGDDAFAVVDELVRIAASHDVEPATVALAWLLAKGVTAPLASARTVEQLPALLAAGSLELTQDDVARLDEASAPFA